MGYREAYESWLNEPSLDEESRRELAAIAHAEREIEERFYCELDFGTAGLRGILGAGTNRMNQYVVRRATQGLADELNAISEASERGVCIAFDSRMRSDEFARETARVLAANGIRVYLFSTLHSVPQLSFAVRRLGCAAGVVITASHNPKQYNGYKVYWAYGGQVSPARAESIYARIQRVPMFGERVCDFDQAVQSGRIELIGEAEDEAYYAATLGLMLRPALVKSHGGSLAVVYTPLHGAGAAPVMTLLKRAGIGNVSIVPAQAKPDGAFPTVSAPNPENPDAFTLAIAQAEQTGAHICLATDPDADRLGVAVKTRGGAWQILTGNQIGCLLLRHILSSLHERDALPKNGVVVKSIVSTRLADAIAARYGVTMETVLTGFRFIGEKVDEYAQSGERAFLFGFEESYGFLAGGLARDKDAICSALLLAELCVLYNMRDRTLSDALDELYAEYGFYRERGRSYTLEGKAGMERISACMAQLRAEPPASFAGMKIAFCEDYKTGFSADPSGRETPLTLPKTNMLRYLLENGAWVVVRPSGTEPKLKLYIGANAPEEEAVQQTLDALYAALDALLTERLGI